MRRASALARGLLIVLGLSACGSEEVRLASLSPAEVAYDVPSFELTVNGQGFDEKSRIVFNGSTLQQETVFVSSGQLKAQVPLEQLTLSFGAEHVAEVPVTVTGKGGGSAPNGLSLRVRQNPVFGETRQVPEPEPPRYTWPLPSLAVVPGGRMDVFWSQEGEVFHSTSPDQGRTWGAYLRFSQRFGLRGLQDPCSAVDDGGGTVVVFVQTNDAGDPLGEPSTLYFARGTGGSAWGDAKAIGGSEMVIASPRIRASAGRIDVVYGQKRDGLSRLLLLTSRDSGATWSESAISEDTYMTFEEPIPLWLSADAAGNAFVTYKRGYNTRYGHQVCYRPSADAGRTWGGEKVLLGYGGWTRGIKVDGGGNPASSGLDMYMPYLSRTVFLFSSDRGQSFRKTAIDESRLISDIFFPDATTTALVYGGRFRRLAEGGSRLYRVSTYTDRNVYDCAAFHDPPQRFYVLWQEAEAGYHVFLTSGQVLGGGA